jgi:hypothetical protein
LRGPAQGKNSDRQQAGAAPDTARRAVAASTLTREIEHQQTSLLCSRPGLRGQQPSLKSRLDKERGEVHSLLVLKFTLPAFVAEARRWLKNWRPCPHIQDNRLFTDQSHYA